MCTRVTVFTVIKNYMLVCTTIPKVFSVFMWCFCQAYYSSTQRSLRYFDTFTTGLYHVQNMCQITAEPVLHSCGRCLKIHKVQKHQSKMSQNVPESCLKNLGYQMVFYHWKFLTHCVGLHLVWSKKKIYFFKCLNSFHQLVNFVI